MAKQKNTFSMIIVFSIIILCYFYFCSKVFGMPRSNNIISILSARISKLEKEVKEIKEKLNSTNNPSKVNNSKKVNSNINSIKHRIVTEKYDPTKYDVNIYGGRSFIQRTNPDQVKRDKYERKYGD